MSVSIGELAVRFGCELRGDPDAHVGSVASLSNAKEGEISFLANPLYRSQLGATRATAVILDAGSAAECPVAALVSPNPYATYARIAALLFPRTQPLAGIHPSAVVAPDASVHASAHVGPFAVIGARASVGERAVIGPHCIVEDDVSIAEDVRLVARVTHLPRGAHRRPRAHPAWRRHRR